MVDHFWLTGPETRVALGIRSIRWFLRGLGGGCFKQRASHKVAFVQESNQRTFGSLGPGSTFCRQPIAPIVTGVVNRYLIDVNTLFLAPIECVNLGHEL
jgi:hypothetical protein